MPIIKSAIKKAKQDEKARKHNRAIRDEYREAAKKVRKLALAGEVKKAQEELKTAYSKIDRAAKRNVIHKNAAARRKSRLSSFLKKSQETKKVEPKKAEKKTEKVKK